MENLGHLDKEMKTAHIDNVVSRLAYPDWLILFYLAKCMDKMNFGCLISNMADNVQPYYDVYQDEEELEENHTPPPGQPFTLPNFSFCLLDESIICILSKLFHLPT